MSDLLSPPYAGYAPFWVHATTQLGAIGTGVRIVWANVKTNKVRVRDRDGLTSVVLPRALWDTVPQTPAVPGEAFGDVLDKLYPNNRRSKGEMQ